MYTAEDEKENIHNSQILPQTIPNKSVNSGVFQNPSVKSQKSSTHLISPVKVENTLI